MCLSMIGLITFQWYWIREALAIQNDRFNDKVAESVRSVAHKLEKQEIVYLLQQRREDEIQKEKLRQMTILARKKDSPPVSRDTVPGASGRNALAYRGGAATGERIPIPHRMQGLQSDALVPSFHRLIEREQQLIEEFFRAQEMGAAGIEEFINRRMNEEVFWGNVLDGYATGSGKTGEYVKKPVRKERSPGQTVASRRGAVRKLPPVPESTGAEELLREVIEDIMYTKRPVEERVNRFLMDSLLRTELVQNGITLPFSFAVRPHNRDRMLFTTANIRMEEWESKAYKAALFPGGTPRSGGLLYVYFPGKQQYVLEKTGAMMTGSVLLVVVVMVCFYLAVSTILSQKKLSDIKNDFINNMTHELKTPISTIGLAVDMAREKTMSGTADPAGITRYMEIIGTENRRLGDQVERVLRIAQMDKGSLELKREVVSVHDLIEKALNSLSVQIEKRNGDLSLEYLAGYENVNVDPVHLTNVIYNLVDNAIKYSPDTLKVTIRTENVEKGISLSVADQGIGLSKEQINRIFDRFYRVPTGNLHDVKGFGLGLSYVKKIVEEHNGKVSVSSKKGEGSTFTIWLPCVGEEAME